MRSTPLYSLRSVEVFQALETSLRGLSSEEAASRRSLYGSNLLVELKPVNHFARFVSHVIHPLALLLWIAGGLALIVREPVLAVSIWLLVLLNSLFSFWREYRAEQAMQALHQLLPSYARLIRDNVEVQIPTSEVVPGDVLVLAEGDNISADARVIEEYGLRTNNSTLTGEAVPARKSADASFREGISELERPNLLFAGTSVVSGTGRAVVYATGMHTQFGRIAHLTQAVREEPSPLQRELVRFTRRIMYVALAIGMVVFLIGAFNIEGMDIIEAFLLALGILVAAVPEGLPATITLSLAFAAQRLAQRGVLVKKLSIIETLGTVSLICTDKSGTLTQNQMTVREIWVDRQRLSVSGVGYDPHGSFTPSLRGTPLEGELTALLEAATLCNNSRLNPPTPERPQWNSLGDQTEVALRVVAQKGGVDEETLNYLYPRVHELPFDARRKRMSTIHRNGMSEIAFVKGAPREVLQLCNQVLSNDKVNPLSQEMRTEILAANDDFARSALRVLALARRELPTRTGAYTVEKVEQDLTFLGLVAMMDPPRPEVAAAVETCRKAGIRMVMITGDYGLTAESLARRVGMLATPDPVILTGAELEELSETDLQNLLAKEVIFARMAPEHKLRLVSAYQALGEVVVVTGDGVNDAPALRKADVGVSMGVIGTDVAKEAADLIVTNDNFGAIVSAIEEGRAVYDNLRKFMTYIFSSNVPEILPFLITALFNLPLALTVQQILAIDLGSDLLPGLALGAEKPEPNVMNRPPRGRMKPLLDNALLTRSFLWLGLIEALLCYIGFCLLYLLSGNAGALHIGLLANVNIPILFRIPPDQIDLYGLTVFFAGVITSQIGNAFACRSETEKVHRLGWFSNGYLWLGIGVELSLIFVLIYVQPVAKIFQLIALPSYLWAGLFLYGPILYGLERTRKSIARWLEVIRASQKQDMNPG